MCHLPVREDEKDPIEMATAAVPVTESFTGKTDDSNSTKQPAPSKQPISPLASSMAKPTKSVQPTKSKYAEGWGLDAMDDFQGKPRRAPKPALQQQATKEASEPNASASNRIPRSGAYLFRCPPDCQKCCRSSTSDDWSVVSGSKREGLSPGSADGSGSGSNTASNSSSSSSLSTLPSSLLSALPSTSTSATSLYSLECQSHINTTHAPPYDGQLMPIDNPNPLIIAETSHHLECRSRGIAFKHNLGVIACAMLHATGRDKECWEDAVSSMEDDVVDEGDESGEERKGGLTVREVMWQLKRRGYVLEGTLGEREWRRREVGWGRVMGGEWR